MPEALSSPMRRVVLEGEYDLTRKLELAALFSKLDTGGPLVIDLSAVTYLDSTVLRELAELRLRCPHSITLVGPSKNIRRILELAQFDRLFPISERDV